MKMTKAAFGVAILLLVLGCSGNEGIKLPEKGYRDMGILTEDEIPVTAQEPDPMSPGSEVILPYRKIIKTGYVEIKSDGINKSRYLIDSLTKKFKCYISSENYYESSSRLNYDYTIRIISGEFDNFLAAVTAGPDIIINKSVNLSDVTDQFYDLSSRLENNKAVELRYRELLNKATAIKDILEIERSLGEIRGEIEAQQGVLNRMENDIAYSTLNINLFQEKSIKETTVAREPFIKRLGKSFVNGWNGFVSFLIVIMTIWPVWIIIIIVWRVVVYFVKKRRINTTEKWKNQ